MKKLTTSIVATTAALLLAAAPMAAEKDKNQDEDVTKQDVEYERTHPDAESQAPHAGLTIYGTVQDFNEDQLTLKTSTGVEHLQIVSQTNHPADLEAGTDVAVDYNRNTQGIMIAKEIRMNSGESIAETGVEETDTQTASTTATTETRDQEMNVQTEESEPAERETDVRAEADVEAESDLRTETEARAETQVAATAETENREQSEQMTAQAQELPQTAGNLPLIALLGLIGLAGAGTLHVLRS